MMLLLKSLWPVLLLTGLFVAGVLFVRHIVVRIVGQK